MTAKTMNREESFCETLYDIKFPDPYAQVSTKYMLLDPSEQVAIYDRKHNGPFKEWFRSVLSTSYSSSCCIDLFSCLYLSCCRVCIFLARYILIDAAGYLGVVFHSAQSLTDHANRALFKHI